MTAITVNSKSHYIAMDVGNSRLKLFSKDSYKAFKYEQSWENELVDYLQELSEKNLKIAYSSVNSSHLEKIVDTVSNRFSVKFIDAFSYAVTNSNLSFSHIKGIGADRVFGMLGALMHSKPPLFTADCGTAITVNAIDENYQCIGGAIFAGAESQNFALGRLTAGLRTIDLDYTENAAADNTKDAMKSGIVRSCAGGIMKICEDINRQSLKCDNPTIYLTGGNALMISSAMKNWNYNVIIVKDLVLRGIYSIFENNCDFLESD